MYRTILLSAAILLSLLPGASNADRGRRSSDKLEITAQNCEVTAGYESLARQLYEDMLRTPAPYRGELEIEAELTDGVATVDVRSSGLTDRQAAVARELADLAVEIVRKGREPGKVKTEVEVEKEV